MKQILALFYFSLLSSCIFAQTHITFGLTYNRYNLHGNNYIDKWYMRNSTYWEEGHGLSLNIQHHLPKFYLQTGINYASDMTHTGILNTNVFRLVEDPVLDLGVNETIATSSTQIIARFEVPLFLGITLLKHKKLKLRVFSGLLPAYRLPYKLDKIEYAPDPDGQRYPIQRQYMVWERVGSQYRAFSLDATIGAGIDIGKFSFDVRRSEGLTNLAHDVEFEGKTYPFTWKSKQLTFTLGWKFRVDKNHPRKQKKVERSYF